MKNSRTSCIQHVTLVELGTTAIFEIGDSHIINPVSNAIAVQRERAIFLTNEFNFNYFPIFAIPITPPEITENIDVNFINNSSPIQVGSIALFSVSSSAVVHLGSSDILHSESRIKHIRHLFRKKGE